MQMEVWITKRGFIYQIILERMHAMHNLDQYTRTSWMNANLYIPNDKSHLIIKLTNSR